VIKIKTFLIITTVIFTFKKSDASFENIYPLLLSTFESINEGNKGQCKTNAFDSTENYALKCIEDICGTAEENSKNLLTNQNINEIIKKEYIDEIDKKKEVIIKVIKKRNKRMLSSLDSAISTFSNLGSTIEDYSDQKILNNFIYIKNSDSKNKFFLSPSLYEAGVITKQEYDNLEDQIRNHHSYKAHFSRLNGSNPDGSITKEDDPNSIQSRCILLKKFSINCTGESNLRIRYEEKIESPGTYSGEFNFFARDSYEANKSKNKEKLISNPTNMKKRIEEMVNSIELISDKSLKEKLIDLSQTTPEIENYMDIEKQFIENMLPLPDDNIDFEFEVIPNFKQTITKIKRNINPSKIILTLEKRKKEVENLSVESQFKNFKVDLLMGYQQAWKNKNFTKHQQKIKDYLKTFIDKMRIVNSERSFKKIKSLSKKLEIKYSTPKFDWFGLSYSKWKNYGIDEIIDTLDTIHLMGSNSINQSIDQLKDPEHKETLPVKITSIYQKLNSSSELGIESLFTSPITDQYNPNKMELEASIYTCSDNQDSKGIFYHELGHFLSHTFIKNKKDISIDSYKNFKTSRECVSKQYINENSETTHLEDSPFFFEGDNQFSEEDFADLVSSAMLKNEPGSSFCSILEYSKDTSGNIRYSDSNLYMKINSHDSHSTALKRIVFDFLQRGNTPSESCNKLMQKELGNFDFTGCLND